MKRPRIFWRPIGPKGFEYAGADPVARWGRPTIDDAIKAHRRHQSLFYEALWDYCMDACPPSTKPAS